MPLDGSETEQESDEDSQLAERSTKYTTKSSSISEVARKHSDISLKEASSVATSANNVANKDKEENDSESDSPVQPARKKSKVRGFTADSSDSGEDRGSASHTARVATGNGPPAKTRGVRQPIKRGAKRF